MNAKISVIIPVYNITDYLEKCLWSVTNQTFRDIEIIVVNDGSTDSSLSVIEKYATKDSRIKIVNKENEGLVMARKTGIDLASGDYIHHLDGDDYIELNCYELMYARAIETNADITVMKFWFDNIDKNEVTESRSYHETECTNFEFLHKIWSERGYYCVWQYIHKRSLYDNKISFCRDLSLGEDAYLTSQLSYYANKMAFLDVPLYHYIIRGSSIINQKMSDKKAADLVLYPLLIRKFMQEKPEYSEMEEDILSLEVLSCDFLLRGYYFKGISANCRRAVKILQKYPNIAERHYIRPLRKVFEVFAFNYLAGLIYVWYYKIKGKI